MKRLHLLNALQRYFLTMSLPGFRSGTKYKNTKGVHHYRKAIAANDSDLWRTSVKIHFYGNDR